jgi:hypothetical protein
MVFQARYRITPRWMVNGHYTLQIKNDGNYEGEGSNKPGNTSTIGDYPEAFSAARNFPEGHLPDFQRSRFRAWTVYDVDLKRGGDVSVSGLWRLDSGRTYSIVAINQAITPQQIAILTAAGYPDLPQANGNSVFFGDRGSQTFPGYGMFDLSLNYNVPVFRTLRPWVKFDAFNLFDNQKLIAWSTTVSQNKAAGVDNLGLATSFTPSTNFGTASGNTVTNNNNSGINSYPLAFTSAPPGGRTLRVAIGFRF